jgi:hypothetical protein
MTTRFLNRLSIRHAAYFMFAISRISRLGRMTMFRVIFLAGLLFAAIASADVNPYQTTLIKYKADKAPCLVSYEQVAPGGFFRPFDKFLNCGNGMLADPYVWAGGTAFVTLKLRKDTIIEVRFPVAIRTFTANLCVGCTDAYNSVSTLQVSSDFGVSWQNLGPLGPIFTNPAPNTVKASWGEQGRTRQSREASVVLRQATDAVWVRGVETVVSAEVKWLPNIYHVRGQP